MSNVNKLLDANQWLELKVHEVVDAMLKAGASTLQMQLCRDDDKAVFAVVVLRGDDTQALLDAMEAKAEALESDL